MPSNEPRLSVASARLRRFALPASFLVGLVVAAASCAADLADPDAYEVARNQGTGVGGTAQATGGTLGTSGGTTASGGTTTTGGTPTAGGPASGGTAGGGTPPPLPACAKAIFNTCSASCHSTFGVMYPELGGGLDLSGEAVAARLADIPSKSSKSTDKAGCGALIDTTTPANSVLIKRIKGDGPCGPVMPGPPGLTATEQKCLEDWVALF